MPALPSYLAYPRKTTNVTGSGYGTGGTGMSGTGDNPLTPLILDPNWGPAVYDTERKGAELAVAGGYSGSPLAGYQTARMRAADIERRAALGNQLLSGQTDRQLGVQGQANQVSQFGQSFGESQRQFDAQQELRRQQLELERQRDSFNRQQTQFKNGGGYNPLPQYMNTGGGSSYSITPWGPGQSGPSGITQRYRY